jgi:Transposase DDE domain/Transposase domain (DUF772)
MSLAQTLSSYWTKIQGELFPFLTEALGPLTPAHKLLVVVIDMVRIDALVHHWAGVPGRPPAERAALGRAFMAKAVFNLSTTRMLIDRLSADPVLRRLCGWSRLGEVPHESTFSRAFAEFAHSELPQRLHEAVIAQMHGDRLIGHIARDATAIHGREKPSRSARPEPKVSRKRGRPRKGEEPPPKQPRRIVLQAAGMSMSAMLADLPRACDVGVKRNAKGYRECWIGYKLHIDTADGDIPISCILTSASVGDSQVAIPLATLTFKRVTNCYDLMDCAYHIPEIADHSRSLGHVPIIDINPRRTPGLKQELADEARRLRLLGHVSAEKIRYNQRSSAERVNGALKDNYGGNTVRVRGHQKVMCHLMFGILAITVQQTLRLIA